MKKKFLIVDDAAFMRLTLKKILNEHGFFDVTEASDGREAFEKYKNVKPNVVTMDITMPEMDGLQAVKRIIEFDPNAKIIMCSAMGQKNMVVEAIKSGAKDFVVKPFDKEKLLGAIQKITDV